MAHQKRQKTRRIGSRPRKTSPLSNRLRIFKSWRVGSKEEAGPPTPTLGGAVEVAEAVATVDEAVVATPTIHATPMQAGATREAEDEAGPTAGPLAGGRSIYHHQNSGTSQNLATLTTRRLLEALNTTGATTTPGAVTRLLTARTLTLETTTTQPTIPTAMAMEGAEETAMEGE